MSSDEEGAEVEEGAEIEEGGTGGGAAGDADIEGRLRPPRAYTLLLLPDDGSETRSFKISARGLRVGLWTSGILGGALFVMALSWVYFAAQSMKVWPLEQRVAQLETETRRVDAVVERFQEVEEAYERLRSIFGATQEGTSDIWLPPTSGRGGSGVENATGTAHPTSWPLTERGFITQPLLEGGVGEHPGVDVAVPSDSYIRAAGSGQISEVGEDPVFGRFVIIDHADGYQSLYAHASSVLVEVGTEVRQNEVVALSGSSGRSSAPHLHFEIRRNGERVDPLTMVTQP